MEHIHEPQDQDVDFYVDPRPLTAEERSRISEYIKKDKEERNKRSTKASESSPGGLPPESKRAKTDKAKHKSQQSI